MEDSGDGVGIREDLEDAHAVGAFSVAGDVEREDAGEEFPPMRQGRGEAPGEDVAESLERAKPSASCGDGSGAAGLGMTCSRSQRRLANTP
ncbi:hypothetical protein HNV28_14655 [Myxococcus xanthus]|uniref:Uncharacterized protein n=1 Tax=Myxococcus xanthus TaxID=34 RepID=A0A7Y4II66_MYXXA|nr:hypothetical protein [Myxococcus xanthus]NOJ79566.1 hypothetical protein [Myxococcus xanthus]NOJ90272.1 hypothetical protein [Myxococcus xanthus]